MEKAIKDVFDNDYSSILENFFQMLLFDCFIGNNDRHYYNWGVVTYIEKEQRPYFSPIFDTARALWWNRADKYIISLQGDANRKKVKLKNYIEKSAPKITIPNHPNCNHFDLVGFLNKKGYLSKSMKKFWSNFDSLNKVYRCIDVEYRRLMIRERRDLIKETLELRLDKMQKILE